MKLFQITYEWRTRPWYQKGRIKTCKVTFAAGNLTDAYKLAQENGKTRFAKHEWKVLHCEDITPQTWPMIEKHTP